MVYFEKLNGEVMNGLDAKDPFPPHLSLARPGTVCSRLLPSTTEVL